MTEPTNPFAGIAALLEERTAMARETTPPVVAAPPSPAENPFAPAPAVAPSWDTGATELPDDLVPSTPPAPEPEPTSAPEPKKRRPGRPRKNPADNATGDADTTGVTGLTDPHNVAATLPPAEAFVALTHTVAALSESRDAVKEQVSDADTRIEEFTASAIRTRAQIEELTNHLETLAAQTEKLSGDAETKRAELSAAEEDLTAANSALDRVRDFIIALSGGNPGIVGGVRVTVLDGITRIDPL